MHHKTSMSYAAVNQNSEKQFDLSEEFLQTTGKHLNESLDTREWLLPERREVNLEEADRVIRGLPELVGKYLQFDRFVMVLNMFIQDFHRSYKVIMEMGIEKMKDVLQNALLAGWDKMNLRDCMSGSIELVMVLRRSVNSTGQNYWLPNLRLRLEISKRALYNLDLVHDAYCNVIPLWNYTITPIGKYDTFYLTQELFKPSTEINDTYMRLRHHISNYIENIDGMIRVYIGDDHKIATKDNVFNYTEGIWQASVNYNNDIRLYESLVIQKPLQRILAARDKIAVHNIRVIAKTVDCQSNWYHFKRTQDELLIHGQTFKETNTTGKISVYLNNLNSSDHASILQLASSLTSDTITQMVEKYKELFSRRYELHRRFTSDILYFDPAQCESHKEAGRQPILIALYANLYGHYKTASAPEKAAMREYFRFKDDFSVGSMLFKGMMDQLRCMVQLLDIGLDLPQMEESSLRNLTTFKKRLDSFLLKTRLDGTFYR